MNSNDVSKNRNGAALHIKKSNLDNLPFKPLVPLVGTIQACKLGFRVYLLLAIIVGIEHRVHIFIKNKSYLI